ETTSSLSVSAGDATLAPACLVAGDRRVCVEGGWQREGNWSVRARTEDFAIDTLDQRTPGRLRYRGLLTVDAAASARAGQPWVADISAGLRESVLEYESASGKTHRVPMGRAVLSLKSNAQQHALDLRVLDATDTSLAAQLTASRIAGRPLRELPVSGSVNGATGQLGLLPLLFTGIDQASGRLRVDLDIAGRLAAPSLTGQAQLTDGAFDFYQANLRLRDTTATIALRQESLELDATASAGEGSLDVEGRLGWRDRRLSGELTLKGDRLLLVDVPEARVFASPDLRFTLADRRIGVTGSVTVPEARIRPAETAGAVLASADERIVRPDFEEEEDERFEIVTDVRLVLGKRVDLDAYGLSGRVSGSVRARTSPHEAAVATGELEVLDGEYQAYSRELDVERGRLLFTGGPATDPGVDLRASRKLGIHTVGVIVRGRLRQPQLTLFSEPPLPQAQIASLLIVGQSLDSLQSGDRDDLQSEQASLASQGGALLAGQLGRHVGLDDVGIAQSGDGAALVLGKFLSPRLYISYGISLVDEINTLKLRYTIGDRWVISLEAGSESAADIEYRIDR
ncbi:MAG: translocation/assembly module TamB domain-containing protein, partial [Pseudomonadota bacterium]|nr:translocation/assembly module TamB domain-containing protein [Pseudomonadota bacterium]